MGLGKTTDTFYCDSCGKEEEVPRQVSPGMGAMPMNATPPAGWSQTTHSPPGQPAVVLQACTDCQPKVDAGMATTFPHTLGEGK